MLERKPEVNFCNHNTGWRPINWLASHGDTEMIAKLLKRPNKEGEYAPSAVSFLADYSDGYFPVDVAGVNGHVATVELLIKDYLENVKKLLAGGQNWIKKPVVSKYVID